MEVLCKRLARTKSKCFQPHVENVYFTPAVFLAGCFNGAPIQSYPAVDPSWSTYQTVRYVMRQEGHKRQNTYHHRTRSYPWRTVSGFFQLLECLIKYSLNSYIIIIIIVVVIFLHGLGRLTCSGIDALSSFPGASTISSSSRFVVEGMFRKSGVVHSFEMIDPVLFVL